MTLKLLLADDHNLLVEAVSNMLNAMSDYEAITTDTLNGALALLNEHGDFDIVLLDLKMPGMVGLESVQKVIKTAGDGKVVLFTGMVDRHFLNSALELGCKGLIPKTMPLKSLDSVIQLIMSGQVSSRWTPPVSVPTVPARITICPTRSFTCCGWRQTG